MFMTERSPPTNSISSPSTSLARPLMRMLRTCAASRLSMGTRSSVHLPGAPVTVLLK
jgi:hypothetical protein